jgi:hypothetical protein
MKSRHIWVSGVYNATDTTSEKSFNYMFIEEIKNNLKTLKKCEHFNHYGRSFPAGIVVFPRLLISATAPAGRLPLTTEILTAPLSNTAPS